jgi:DNA-binding NtrC family response regulator/Flp pilus assembly protein TadD
VQRWLQVRLQAPGWPLHEHAAFTEAVGWSLALTKQWSHFDSFRDEVVGDARHCALLDNLEAWRSIHESRYDASVHLARRTRAALLDDPVHRHLAQSLKVEGVALFRLGRYAEAEPLMQQAASLFRVLGDTLNISHCCTNLGIILNARGEIRAAREALRESLSILETLGAAEQRVALARENLAMVELHLGNEPIARHLLESALDVFESLQLRSETLTAWNGLGHCARQRGDHEEAIACHQRVIESSTNLPRQRGLALEFLGQVYFDREQWKQAESCYRQAHDIAAGIAPDGDLMVEACWRLAELLSATGRLAEAADYVLRAEQLCTTHDDRREWGCVQRARGRLLAAQGNIELAETTLTQALTTLEATGRLFEAALTRLLLAEVSEATAPWLDAARSFFADVAGKDDSHWLRRVSALRTPLQSRARTVTPQPHDDTWGFVTRDPRLRQVLQDIPTMARSEFPVLIQGESGTGKELLARALHEAAGRTGPFIAVNCAAIPESLFESEIFGHARGAFSGAQGSKPGLFEQAHGGTLMLDEIGDMPLEMQAKLLRVLDDGRVRRVGEVQEKRVDCKVIAASNRPLHAEGIDGVFRRDLFHRLSVHQILIPPLRERPGDIEPLACMLLKQHGLEDKLDLTSELLDRLRDAPWPGNVRELRNKLVRFALHPESLQEDELATVPASGARTLRDHRSDHERRIILDTLQQTDWHVASAADLLDMHVTTLRRKMRRLEVQRPS